MRQGDTVKAGDSLGLVGYSGNTQFPHVEMIVRRDGAVVDPCVGSVAVQSCEGPHQPLWHPDVATVMVYSPAGVLQAGFATERPDDDRIREGAHRDATLPAGVSALVFWFELLGPRAGDSLAVRVVGPDGRSVFAHSLPIDRDSAVRIFSAPVRRPSAGYLSGAYEGQVELIRAGVTVASQRRTVTLTDIGCVGD